MENNKFEITVNRFTEEASNKFAKDVAEAVAIDQSHPITVYIDSYGGQVYSLISMMETMRAVPNPFITVCKGKAMSCGAMLLAMGDQRFCGQDSSIMIHEVSAGAIGNVDDIKVEAKEIDRLNKQVMELLASKIGMTFKQLKDLINKDGRRELYLTAQEAKNLGLVHAIGMPLIKPIVMYHVDVVPAKNVIVEQQSTQPKTKTVSKNKKKKKKK